MTTPSPVETTLKRLSAQAGAPRFERSIRRGGRSLASFAVWCHDGAAIDLTGLRTAQLVLALTGGQRAEIRGETSCRHRRSTAGDVGFVVPAVSPHITITGRAGTLQVILADEMIAAAPRLSSYPAASPRALAAQALVALRADAEEDFCGAIALQVARRFASSDPPHPARARSGGLAPHVLRRVCDLMRTRLATAPDHLPNCDELAERAVLSKFHFIRAFRVSTGLTPGAWLMERRIERAYAALLEGGATVGDVAERTGFASSAHFVDTFRRRDGLTPAALRDAATDLLAAAA